MCTLVTYLDSSLFHLPICQKISLLCLVSEIIKIEKVYTYAAHESLHEIYFTNKNTVSYLQNQCLEHTPYERDVF